MAIGCRPRWGLMSAGGPTPYPHIALCATAPKSIYSRRAGRMRSDVQKRCLPPRQLLSGVIQWPEPGLTATGTDSSPMKTDSNPLEQSSRAVIDHVVVNRADARLPTRRPRAVICKRHARRPHQPFQRAAWLSPRKGHGPPGYGSVRAPRGGPRSLMTSACEVGLNLVSWGGGRSGGSPGRSRRPG
jgi:hypothetical protein